MSDLRSVAFVLAIAMSATGVAAPAASPGMNAGRVGEFHCVVTVTGQAGDGRLITGPATCFGGLAEAITFASGGAVQLDRGTSGDIVFSDRTIASKVSAFTLGIHYEDRGGRGSSVTVVGTSCSGGYWNAPSWLGNKISSSYHGCGSVRHHDLPDLGGGAYTTTGIGITQDLVGFDNRAESVRYLP